MPRVAWIFGIRNVRASDHRALAYNFSKRRDLAIVSGLLAVFSIYYAPFIPVSDNYGIYIVLGGNIFFALFGSQTSHIFFSRIDRRTFDFAAVTDSCGSV